MNGQSLPQSSTAAADHIAAVFQHCVNDMIMSTAATLPAAYPYKIGATTSSNSDANTATSQANSQQTAGRSRKRE